MSVELANGTNPFAINNQYELINRLQVSIDSTPVIEHERLAALFTMLDFERENLLKMRDELNG